MTCPTCGDDGWIIDHDEECYESGDCIGCGGVQVRCDDPRGHADRCTKCDGSGNVWAGDGPGDCRHCTGGYVFRNGPPLSWT